AAPAGAALGGRDRRMSAGDQSHGRAPPASRDLAEFLPAALEIEASPASPLARAVALCIALLLVAALAWATYGRVDVVAVARGRLIPAGHSRVVHPPEAGY